MRLTRRTFIMASGISAGALMTGCAGMAQARSDASRIGFEGGAFR